MIQCVCPLTAIEEGQSLEKEASLQAGKALTTLGVKLELGSSCSLPAWSSLRGLKANVSAISTAWPSRKGVFQTNRVESLRICYGKEPAKPVLSISVSSFTKQDMVCQIPPYE